MCDCHVGNKAILIDWLIDGLIDGSIAKWTFSNILRRNSLSLRCEVPFGEVLVLLSLLFRYRSHSVFSSWQSSVCGTRTRHATNWKKALTELWSVAVDSRRSSSMASFLCVYWRRSSPLATPAADAAAECLVSSSQCSLLLWPTNWCTHLATNVAWIMLRAWSSALKFSNKTDADTSFMRTF